MTILSADADTQNRKVLRTIQMNCCASESGGDFDALLEDIEKRTFTYFQEVTDPATGLAPDYVPDSPCASTAAMGFSYMAMAIGAERNWIDRSVAARLVRRWLEFLRDAPSGPHKTGASSHRGFYYHFLNMDNGTRHADCEISTADTAILILGIRFCALYFSGTNRDEEAIRTLAELLSDRVDWSWALTRRRSISMGWLPETGFLDGDWVGYNEGLVVYVLAMGLTSAESQAASWLAWQSGYENSWGGAGDSAHLRFGSLFAHFLGHIWIDFRGINEQWLQHRGLDYCENSRRAVAAQVDYAIQNAHGWVGYGSSMWGLSACFGPGESIQEYKGLPRTFRDYVSRGIGSGPFDSHDDGTICPSAIVASLPFSPEIVRATIFALNNRFGAHILTQFGYVDCFNPSFRYTESCASGIVLPEHGWISNRHYGVNQGPVLAMIENYRSGLIWNTMRKDVALLRGLRRAGFGGGWLSVT